MESQDMINIDSIYKPVNLIEQIGKTLQPSSEYISELDEWTWLIVFAGEMGIVFFITFLFYLFLKRWVKVNFNQDGTLKEKVDIDDNNAGELEQRLVNNER